MESGTGGDLLFGMLRATSLRARSIGSNIANLETPGYVRQIVRFEDLVQAELERKHPDLSRLKPLVETEALEPGSSNGVNLELEIASARMNRLQSEMWNTLLQARFGLIKASIESGR